MAPVRPSVQGSARALGWVLEHGVPAEVQVTSGSMEPTLPRGTHVSVSPVDDRTELQVGDVVVMVNEEAGFLITHRLMHAFVEGGRRFIIHQGDAPRAAFGVARREQVVARVTGVVGPGPTDPSALEPTHAPRFVQRRLVCRAYALARGLATSAGLGRSPVLRRCGALFRRLAGRVTD